MKNQTPKFTLTYIADKDVDGYLDRELTALLSVCFPGEERFRRQRFCREVPAHRWIITDGNMLSAHTAMHEKEITVNGEKYKTGGIAEVCVEPSYRGLGLVKTMLKAAHVWMRENGYDFSLLWASHTNVYASSGYCPIPNEVKYYDPDANVWLIKAFPDMMAAQIGIWEFPDGLIELNGPKF
jgi:GNAT superfamily N-acetyltransferase